MSENEIGISVLKSACSSEAKDLAADWAELGLDALLDDGVLKDAPMLGTVVKVCVMSKTIRDRLFVRKVWDFLRACPKFNDLERLGFAREHLDDPKKAQRLGDAIVLLIDKLDDLDKPRLLAKVFAALVRGKIDLATFRRLASAIDIGFVDDLKTLVGEPRHMEDLVYEHMPNLIRTGLSEIRGPQMKPSQGKLPIGPVKYHLSKLGLTFIECMNE